MKEDLNVNGDFSFTWKEKRNILKKFIHYFSPVLYIPQQNYFDIFKVRKIKNSTKMLKTE